MSALTLAPATERALRHYFGVRRPSRWVTRARPKIDRIACPWLVRRFVDPEAEIRYVPAEQVLAEAARTGALAFDIPGAPITHEGELCSFDVLIARFAIDDPGVRVLAPIVRGADTDRHELAPQAAGLHAISLGLAALHDDDQALLEQGLWLYDALYSWARSAREVRHAWTYAAPQML